MTTITNFRSVLLDLGKYVHTIVAETYRKGIEIVDPKIVGLVINVLSDYDALDLIKPFIDGSYSHWDRIFDRDESFFTDHLEDVFFYMRPERRAKLNLFKQLVQLRTTDGQPALSTEVKQHIWKLLHYLVKYSLKYMYETGYGREHLCIDVKYSVEKWKVKLDGVQAYA